MTPAELGSERDGSPRRRRRRAATRRGVRSCAEAAVRRRAGGHWRRQRAQRVATDAGAAATYTLPGQRGSDRRSAMCRMRSRVDELGFLLGLCAASGLRGDHASPPGLGGMPRLPLLPLAASRNGRVHGFSVLQAGSPMPSLSFAFAAASRAFCLPPGEPKVGTLTVSPLDSSSARARVARLLLASLPFRTRIRAGRTWCRRHVGYPSHDRITRMKLHACMLLYAVACYGNREPRFARHKMPLVTISARAREDRTLATHQRRDAAGPSGDGLVRGEDNPDQGVASVPETTAMPPMLAAAPFTGHRLHPTGVPESRPPARNSCTSRHALYTGRAELLVVCVNSASSLLRLQILIPLLRRSCLRRLSIEGAESLAAAHGAVAASHGPSAATCLQVRLACSLLVRVAMTAATALRRCQLFASAWCRPCVGGLSDNPAQPRIVRGTWRRVGDRIPAPPLSSRGVVRV
eukprot:6203347-Pleurochrysis_carterae.AAC.2